MITIYPVVVGPIETNCYVVANADREAIIIDPGAEAETITAAISREAVKPTAILITHGHYDHILAAPELAARYSIPIWYPAQDQYLLPAEKAVGILPQAFDLSQAKQYTETVTVEGFTIKVMHAPGHTAGQCCFLIEDNLFSGDMLFTGGYLGRTDLWGGSDQAIQKSLKQLLLLADTVRIFPGHGAAGTIGGERGYYE